MTLAHRALCLCSTLFVVGCFNHDVDEFGRHETDTGAAADNGDPGIDLRGNRPPPIVGGTMLLTDEGDVLAIADPARDLVLLVDVSTRELHAEISLEVGAAPFRLASGPSEELFVLAEGGRLLSVNVRLGSVEDAIDVCSDARDLAYDDDERRLWVGCAHGRVEAYGVEDLRRERTFSVPSDVRDIHIVDKGLMLSTFRRADVVWLDHSGTILGTDRPLPVDDVPAGWGFADRQPAVARATATLPGGGWFMLHQRGGAGVLVSAPKQCDSPTAAAFTLVSATGEKHTTGGIHEAGLLVDAAVNPARDTIAAVSASRSDGNNLLVVDTDMLEDSVYPGCVHPRRIDVPGQITSVVFEGDDRVWVYSREPAGLLRVDLDGGYRHTVDLDLPSVADSVHDLFHLETPIRASCATCHPEGGEDGLTWQLEGIGLRRTRPLRADLPSIYEPLRKSHGGSNPVTNLDAEGAAALAGWLSALPRPVPARDEDDPLAVAGRAAFEELGCDDCHGGPSLSSGPMVDPPDAGMREPPSLLGVGSRAPYMHDGRADDLRGAVLEMVEWTTPAFATFDQVDAIVAYLESI